MSACLVNNHSNTQKMYPLLMNLAIFTTSSVSFNISVSTTSVNLLISLLNLYHRQLFTNLCLLKWLTKKIFLTTSLQLNHSKANYCCLISRFLNENYAIHHFDELHLNDSTELFYLNDMLHN